MNRYEKVNHKEAKIIVLVGSFICFIACIYFGYLHFNSLKNKPLVDYPKYTISNSNWTNQDILITVNNKNVDSYSIDNGKTFQKYNTFEISENGEYMLVVKDIHGKLSNSIPIRINKIDKDPPIITFSDETVVKVGDIFYPRSGVSITDGEGSGVVENYKIDPSSIDTSVEGTYKITYTVLDNAQNITTKVRTVIVKK